MPKRGLIVPDNIAIQAFNKKPNESFSLLWKAGWINANNISDFYKDKSILWNLIDTNIKNGNLTLLGGNLFNLLGTFADKKDFEAQVFDLAKESLKNSNSFVCEKALELLLVKYADKVDYANKVFELAYKPEVFDIINKIAQTSTYFIGKTISKDFHNKALEMLKKIEGSDFYKDKLWDSIGASIKTGNLTISNVIMTQKILEKIFPDKKDYLMPIFLRSPKKALKTPIRIFASMHLAY